MSLKLLNVSQLGEVTGVNRKTVAKKLENFTVEEVQGNAKLYDAPRAVRAILLGDIDGLDKKIQAEEFRVKQAQANKLELQVGRLNGELVQIEDVCKEIEKEYGRVRAALLSLPTRLAKLVSMEGDPAVIKSMLDEAIAEALEHLTQDKDFKLEETNDVEPVEQIISDETEGIEAPAPPKPG